MSLQSLKLFVRAFKKQLLRNWTLVILNSLTILLFLGLTGYVKFGGSRQGNWRRAEAVVRLFSNCFSKEQPFYSWLNNLSEIFWCLSVAACLFSLTLLRTIHPQRKINLFILCSTLLITVLLIDDMFQLTVIFELFIGVPKLLMYSLYGIAGITYGFFFRRRLRSTPYVLLLVATALFVFSNIVDLLHLPGFGTPVMLEEGTKLVGLLNFTYYFWYVCKSEVMRLLS